VPYLASVLDTRPTVELKELDDDTEIRRLARNSLYTWELTNRNRRTNFLRRVSVLAISSTSHDEIRSGFDWSDRNSNSGSRL